MTSLLQKRLEEELLADLERGTIVWNDLGSVNRVVYASRLGVTRKALSQEVLKRFDDLGPRPPQMDAVLRSMLEEDYQAARLVFSKPGCINKLNYARRAGCSNTQYYKALFEEYEERAGNARTADTLARLLSADFDAQCVPFSRDGKIDRGHYAKLLGVTKSALTNHIALFSEFEERFGERRRYREDDLRRMAEWLETNFRANQLRFRKNGKLVRSQFAAAFHIKYADFETRFPEIGDLVQKYDYLRPATATTPGTTVGTDRPVVIEKTLIAPTSKRRARETSDVEIATDGKSAASRSDEERRNTSPSVDILAAIEAAVAEDIKRGQLRLAPDGTIDQAFYVMQAVTAVSIEVGKVFGQYTSEIKLYHHQKEIDEPSAANEPDATADAPNELLAAAIELIEQPDTIEMESVSAEDADDEPEAPEEVGGDLAGAVSVYYPRLKRHQGYGSESPLFRAVRILNEYVLGPGLPRTVDGGLNRAEIQNILRISRSELVNYDQVLVDYDIATRFGPRESGAAARMPVDPALHHHQGYPPTSAFGRAVTILNSMIGSRGLPRVGGVLDDAVLARELGINPRGLQAYRFILDDYDQYDRSNARAEPNLLAPALAVEVPSHATGSTDAETGRLPTDELLSLAPVAGFIPARRRPKPATSNRTPPDTDQRPALEETARLDSVTSWLGVQPIRQVCQHPGLRKHRFYKAGSVRHKLVELLDRHYEHETPGPLTKHGLACELGLTDAALGKVYSDVIDDYRQAAEGTLEVVERPSLDEVVKRFPDLEKHQYYRDATRTRLVEILNEGLLQDDIPRSRAGKIDRRGLTKKFGFAGSAMTHYRDILHDYERVTGGLVNAHERRLPEMEAWLKRSMEEGSLEIRDDKVERRQFFQQFELANTKAALVRNPRILALLKKYDEIAVSTGYLPNRVREEVERLKAALADNPPIYKTGLSFNRTVLAKIINVSLGRIARSPFKEVLDEADQVLKKQTERDELCHIFAGRLFSFRDLLEAGWTSTFLKKIADGFRKIYHSKGNAAAKEAFNVLKVMLRFLGTSEDFSCRAIRAALNTGNVRSVLERDWTLATQLYASYTDNRDELNGAAPASILTTASNVLRHLGNAGVLPELEMTLRSKGGPSQQRRTLAEDPSKEGVDDYLAFATAMLKEAAKGRQIELDAEAETGFLKTLRTELRRTEANSDDTPSTIILRVLKRRLGAIEDAIAAIYVRWQRHWERGQQLLKTSKGVGENWGERLVAGSRNYYQRRTELRAFFPLDDTDRSIANLIRLVVDNFNGLFPPSERGEGSYGAFFAKRALEFAPRPELQAYIYPHPDAVCAVLLLNLCASGINVAVGRTYFTDGMEPSQISGATYIAGVKARARGKPIHAHIHSKSHAVTGLKWLLEASSGLRSMLDADDRNLLFVVNSRNGPSPLQEYSIRHLLKRVVAEIPELADLDITPAMLRPTVLLIAALEGDANAHKNSALAQHTLNVNRRYSDRFPTRFMHDQAIRDFVDGLEIVSFHMNEDVQEWLGYSKSEVETQLDGLMETGLGTLCRDIGGRPGNDGGRCKTFDCWNSCPQLVVIARKRDLAMLVIWRASLMEAEPTWIEERPERWYGLWFPWLEFIRTVERKITTTTMGKIWREAVALAEELMAHPNFKPRRPY
ncbi:hypothetical protein [Rhizobium lentis]|uniref:hypothetical protein n=1 Tax=Rhizobium lentis TaxID=1138194 RepID=UPI001C83A9FB|nr:hypothetical protein [Rhizobium lentis]MBX5014949.1 hypothetical protein [Rhizobium lentis]